MTVSRFTPSLMTRGTLEEVFVARHDILDTLTARIAEAASSSSRHHCLVVGPRGAGKTHLIALAYHRTVDLMSAGRPLQVAWLPEDPWTILTYRHLLASIVRHLEPRVPPPVDMGAGADALEAFLMRQARDHGPIVVLVENFDQVLDQLEDVEQQRLRRLLQTERSLLVIATTTRLDRNLSDQARPFYGFFTPIRLKPFTVEEAQSMLQALARHEGNEELAAYVGQERTKRRLRTIAHLAGGQPRIWSALSTALTIEGLDTLVDLLLTRFDDLTPYYQEQLGRLSGQMRLVVAELAHVDHPLHVAELAERIGVSQRSLGKTVSDLADRGWVAPVSTPVADLLDGRRTYYELAEPLARLSFQIKESRGEPLRLVVDFLKGWFDPDEMTAASTLQAVAYLEMARDGFSYDPITRVVRHLAALPQSSAPALEMLGRVDDALAALADGDAGPLLRLNVAIRQSLEERLLEADTRAAALHATRIGIHRLALSETQTHPARVDDWVLRAEVLVASERDLEAHAVLVEWLAQAGRIDEASAVLVAMVRLFGELDSVVLSARFTVAQQYCILHTASRGIEQFDDLARDQAVALGEDHHDTLSTRHHLAYWRGEAGDVAGAVAGYAELLPVVVRVWGPDHPDTLTTRHNLADSRGKAGDVAGALAGLTELLPVVVRVMGPDHPDTLTTRGGAGWRGEAGDVAGALVGLAELLSDMERVLGPDHPDTLTTRHNLASWQEKAGDVAGAVAGYAEVLSDRVRVLGPDHPATLATRANLTRWRGEAGDVAGAVAGYAEVLSDMVRVLGPDHPDTLTARHNLASWRGEAGDVAGAVAGLAELLPDRERVSGPDHLDTLATRNHLAYWRGEAGDVAGAVTGFEEVLPDRVRVLGPDHPATLSTRANLAHWRAKLAALAGGTGPG